MTHRQVRSIRLKRERLWLLQSPPPILRCGTGSALLGKVTRRDDSQASSWPSWIAEPTDKRTYLLNTRVEVCSCPLRWLLIFRALSLWPADMLLSSFGLPASVGLRQTQNVGASLCPMVRMMWWVRRVCAGWGTGHFFMEKLNRLGDPLVHTPQMSYTPGTQLSHTDATRHATVLTGDNVMVTAGLGYGQMM